MSSRVAPENLPEGSATSAPLPTASSNSSDQKSKLRVRRLVIITIILTILLLLAVILIVAGLVYHFKSPTVDSQRVSTFLSVSEAGIREYSFFIKQVPKVIGNRTYTANTIDGYMPGPAIHVLKGETLSVKVTNGLTDNGLSIHWHGFDMAGNQVYDGVVGLTQCPIAPGKSYKYHFKVDEEPGTYWYHTHNDLNPSGQDFVRGPLIVHQSNASLIPQTTIEDSYNIENERILFYQDLYPNYLGFDLPMLDGGGDVAFSDRSIEGFEIGSGLFAWASGVLNGEVQHEIKVENGEYRFRIINGGDQFPYFFSIDGYKLTVVATDGYPVEPYESDVIQVLLAERYDILIIFDITTPTQNVWIRAMTISAKQDKGTWGILRVRKDSSIAYDEKLPPNKFKPVDMTNVKILNCIWYKRPEYDCRPVTELVPKKERRLLDSFDYHTADFLDGAGGMFVSLNGEKVYRQNLIPDKPLIMKSDQNKLNPNTNMLNLPKNQSVTLVLRSKAMGNHPMHLHGHHFEVLEIALRNNDTCRDDICPLLDLDTAFSEPIDTLMKRERQGVLKDTVNLPPGGALALRINTDNPGVWFLHCHIHIHLHEGMALALNERNYTFSQEEFPDDYPSCNFTGRMQLLRSATCNGTDEWSNEPVSYSKPYLCGVAGN